MPVHTQEHGAEEAHEHDHGRLLDRGWRYDLEVWFLDTFWLRGKVRAMRARVLELAKLGDGQALLDVGCGTGTLAIEAARRSGPTLRVAGIDPAPRQIGRARGKARRARLDVDFRQAGIEALPYADASLDAVTSTLMIHHLPEELQRRGLAEIGRVLEPGGRLVVADVLPGDAPEATSEQALVDLLEGSGFAVTVTERVQFPRAHHGWSAAVLLAATRR
jgi:ubiquinone/menaquinone biosynthesis C-methylase UbiE